MTKQELLSQPYFQELLNEVQQVMTQKSEQCHRMDVLEEEATQLQNQINGWMKSLANPDLQAETRRLLEAQMNNAVTRLREIELLRSEEDARTRRVNTLVDSCAVVERLERLADVLAAHNPTLANIELAQHIDRINCFADGRVVLRTCRLGILADAVDLLATYDQPNEGGPVELSPIKQIQPRRLACRSIASDGNPTEEKKALAQWSTDPHRFNGLDERWFEEHEFEVPKPGWYFKHAAEVVKKRAEGLSHEELAEIFGRSIPTIRKALHHAASLDPAVKNMLAKRPRRRWHEDHFAEVMELVEQGLSVPKIAQHFGKSEPTIRKAVEFAQSTELPLEASA